MAAINTKVQIFTIWNDEIKGRLDPLYLRNISLINGVKTKYNLVALGNLLKSDPQYGANEIAVDGNPNSDVRYIRITDIDEFGNLKKDNWKTANKIEQKYFLKDGDILFARSGATAGKTFIYKNKYRKAIFAGYLIRFRFDNARVKPDFVFYYTQLNRYANWVKSIQRPSGQPNINSEEFKSFEIPLPSLETQNRIVSKMQKAYDQKEANEKKVKEILDSIDDYILGELGIKMPEIKNDMIFEISSDEVEGKRIDAEYWKPFVKAIEKSIKNGKCKSEQLKNYISKIHYGVSTKNDYVEKGIPLLRILNLKENKIDVSNVVYLSELERKTIGNAFVQEGDLLISRSGSVGIVSVVPQEANDFAFGSFMIKFCLNNKINKDFVSIWLNNKLSKLITEREKIGAIQGNITIGTIENFKIPIPPIEIQNKIAAEVKKRISEAERLEKEADEIVEKAKKEVEGIILGKE